MSRCFFRCSYEVAELGHLPEVDQLEFRFDKPRPCVVRLSKSYWDRQKPADAGSAICVAETTEETIDETADFLHGILDELYISAMIPTVSVLRWRCGLAEGPPNPGRNLKGYYSNDGESWRELSMVRSFKISFGIPRTGPLPPLDVIRSEVVELIKTSTEEPLGRQLFREAWSERATRPRSALVIGVAAAEVGFKKLVGSLVPQAQWLMDEVQTPSLGKMLRKFLPTLPIKARFQGKSVCPPNGLLNQLDKAIECRNKLVHTGQPPPNSNELDKMLRAVSDFLWICDVYAGQRWACEYISAETRTAWAAPHQGK